MEFDRFELASVLQAASRDFLNAREASRAKHRDSLELHRLCGQGEEGGSERTHLPAIIFALRIIIASP